MSEFRMYSQRIERFFKCIYMVIVSYYLMHVVHGELSMLKKCGLLGAALITRVKLIMNVLV